MKFSNPLTEAENKKLKEAVSKKIASNIKTFRNRRGITQQELSDSTGLHLTYIAHLEAAKYHPSTFVLWKISQALEYSMDEFVK